MRKPFGTTGKFYRNGTAIPEHLQLSSHRSFATLRAALTGVRLDLAEVIADGFKPPLEVLIWYQHPKKRGQNYGDTEIVAVWKRGRFVWVDRLFKERQ